MITPALSTRSIAAAPTARSASFYQRLVLRALGGLGRGQLQLTLPDGSRHLFGGECAVHWHETTRSAAARALPSSASIEVRHPAFFKKCVLFGDIGFAESYLDGDWETTDISAVIAWFLLNRESAPTLSGSTASGFSLNLLRSANRLRHLFRSNDRRTAARNIREHYDLSNDFFRLWLDPTLMYSSARWEQPNQTLEQAQDAKNEELCRKLQLRPADHVLEIGTGWGGWSLHAARNHGCRVTTLTLSPAQAAFARERVSAAGLSDRIEVRLQDYRDVPPDEVFDKVVSIEMLEAVGHEYLETWCALVSRVLKPDGLMALQFITCPDARYPAMRRGVDFIQKHVFPGSLLLSVNRLNELLADTGGFVLHALDDLGSDYARTLRLWRGEFNRKLGEVQELGFDGRFIRKWNYYLSYCEAAFALRNISVVQTVHTRPNNLSLA
jgi:cyclopropane-fatty-acyl-phospholipid synthase